MPVDRGKSAAEKEACVAFVDFKKLANSKNESL